MVTYAKVVGRVSGARDDVLAGFKLRGGERDRWQRRDWEAMASVITAVEDREELLKDCEARRAVRSDLMAVRRELEAGIG